MPSPIVPLAEANGDLQGVNGLKSTHATPDRVSQELRAALALGRIDTRELWESGPKPNLSLWVTKDHRIYTREIPYPVCGPQDCIVHIRATGICGSEIHFWKTGRIGDCCVDHDLILGHESAGVVCQVGAEVTGLVVGDRVSVEPGVPCLGCRQCLLGRYNLCPTVKFSGTPPSHGTMSRYVAHPARFLHKMPDSMSFAQGALVEPLSVAAGAVDRAQIKLGQPVLVCGAGPIGLAAALCARAAGAYPICITDLDENRLQQARALGIAITVKVDPGWSRTDFAAEIQRVMGEGCRPEIALECTGAQSSIAGAIYAVVDGGTLLQVGCGKPEIELPIMAMSFREVNIVSSFRYKHTWPTVIRLLDAGVLGEADKLITHTFALEDVEQAFETCVTPSARSIKVQIVD